MAILFKRKAGRRRKYRNRKVEYKGFVFDSIRECRRYIDLEDQEKNGEITDLELQPEFSILIHGQLVCKYIADFQYTIVATGEVIVEDAKGFKTTIYRLKKKLMKIVNGIEVKET